METQQLVQTIKTSGYGTYKILCSGGKKETKRLDVMKIEDD